MNFLKLCLIFIAGIVFIYSSCKPDDIPTEGEIVLHDYMPDVVMVDHECAFDTFKIDFDDDGLFDIKFYFGIYSGGNDVYALSIKEI